MPDKIVYEYASIRLVPKVEREEFINIGVILFCKQKKYLAMKYQISEKRLEAFAEDMDLEEVREHLYSWELICEGDPRGGAIAQQDMAYRFRWITAPKSTILQCSQVHPGLCEEPGGQLEVLFEKYVL
jgi:hypothetical protein